VSDAGLVVRLRKTSDALERVIALVRRRAFALRRLSVAEAGHNVVEVCLRIDESKTPRDRVRVELEKLVDVLDVRDVSGEPATGKTRELLLARLHPERAAVTDSGRALHDEHGTVLELIGSPDEVDAALARLAAAGALQGFVRSGEVLLPQAGNTPPYGETQLGG
jgi:acetolactate synthase small subunit